MLGGGTSGTTESCDVADPHPTKSVSTRAARRHLFAIRLPLFIWEFFLQTEFLVEHPDSIHLQLREKS